MSYRKLIVAAFSLVVAVSPCIADQPEPAETEAEEVRPRPIGFQHLAVLGNLAWELREYRDNEFIYEERLQDIQRYADAVDGRDVIWDVAVLRVDKSDVYVEVPAAARTRVVVASRQTEQALAMLNSSLFHSGDFVTPSAYMDYFKPQSVSRYRAYYGPPSTMRYNLLAAPTALRIGEAIALEDAKQLRSRDFLRVTGRVEQVIMRVPSGFLDDIIVVIKDIRVLQVNPSLIQ